METILVTGLLIALFVVLPVVILLATDWIRDTRRKHSHEAARRKHPERYPGTPEYEARLRHPQFDELERSIGNELPQSYKDVFNERNLVLKTDLLITPPHAVGETDSEHIQHFIPADPLGLEERWEVLDETCLVFATDGGGDNYYLALSEGNGDDAPVYKFSHDGGDHHPVAPSLCEFLTWPITKPPNHPPLTTDDPPMTIDAHQHFWQLGRFDTSWLDVPEHEPIRRDFLPADLKPLIDAAGVDRTVFVQTQHNIEENRWALALADEYDWISGVVGWVDLASDQCEEQLLEFKEYAKFVGVRHITQGEPDVDFIVRPDVIRGLTVLERHGVPFDLLFFVKHLHHAQTLARRLPELRMVIDHLAKPHIKQDRLDDWEENFRAAAKYPNLYCKLSGMVTEADWENWRPADLKPYVDVALEAFGPDRLMFGSDWPVCELAGSYQQVFDALNECLGPISDDERDHIFAGTAREFYGLSR